jgi:hypothetical protein
MGPRPRCGRHVVRRRGSGRSRRRPAGVLRSPDAGGALIHLASFAWVAGSGPTGEVPWRLLIDGPSAGRRPVAAPGNDLDRARSDGYRACGSLNSLQLPCPRGSEGTQRHGDVQGGTAPELLEIARVSGSIRGRTRECPRQESNLRTRFRKPLLSPLSYGGFLAWSSHLSVSLIHPIWIIHSPLRPLAPANHFDALERLANELVGARPCLAGQSLPATR